MTDPVRIPLFTPLGTRDASLTKDARVYDGYVEKGDEQGITMVFKRPAFKRYDSYAPAGTPGLGVFNWKQNLYAVFGGTLYKDTVAVGAVDATSAYSFSSCLGATPKLFLKNLTKAYVYDSVNGLVAVTNPNYPPATVTGAVYLDGTMYVMDAKGAIYGSDFNDPTSWDPLNLIVAQIEPDAGLALMKQLVYVCAVKEQSVEVFYDAGNAVGSPLAPVQGAKVSQGARAAGTVQKVGDDICWVSTSEEGDVNIFHMMRVRAADISPQSVDRVLVGMDYSTVYSWAARIAGHRIYAVTSKVSNVTVVMDLGNLAAYIWRDPNGNYLPFVSSTHDINSVPVLQHESDGCLYTTKENLFQDQFSGLQAIPFDVYTHRIDLGALLTKLVTMVAVVGDEVDTTVDVSWSDDDYQTWSPPVTVQLNQPWPVLQDGSSFRRRAYRVSHRGNTQLRLEALEFTASVGSI